MNITSLYSLVESFPFIICVLKFFSYVTHQGIYENDCLQIIHTKSECLKLYDYLQMICM